MKHLLDEKQQQSIVPSSDVDEDGPTTERSLMIQPSRSVPIDQSRYSIASISRIETTPSTPPALSGRTIPIFNYSSPINENKSKATTVDDKNNNNNTTKKQRLKRRTDQSHNPQSQTNETKSNNTPTPTTTTPTKQNNSNKISQSVATGHIGDKYPLPYKQHSIRSRLHYYYQTFLVIHPKFYALFLLARMTVPRLLVLFDMATDIIVAVSLWENNETFWFMLSSLFIFTPFLLVWCSSLRFVQKRWLSNLKSTKNVSAEQKKRFSYRMWKFIQNLILFFYIMPPTGSVMIFLFEICWIFSDIITAFIAFFNGTGIVHYENTEFMALKSYRRTIGLLCVLFLFFLFFCWMHWSK